MSQGSFVNLDAKIYKSQEVVDHAMEELQTFTDAHFRIKKGGKLYNLACRKDPDGKITIEITQWN